MSPLQASLRRPLSLRSRLLLTIAVISTLAALTVGAGAVIALRTIGVQQVDSQLVGATQRSVDPQGSPVDGARGSTPPPGPPSDPASQVQDLLQRPGQSAGTLIALSDSTSNGLTAAVLDQTGEVLNLPSADVESLSSASLGATPVTVSLPGLGDYRVVADVGPDGGQMITGLPLSTVQDTAVRLAVVVALVTLLVLALGLTAGSALVRIALRPLERVRATATRVSELTLDQGDVALAERVPNPQPDTEIGQVTAALNRMLEHVARALQSRQGSEMRLRRFVADASHELRTPLASIRGYSELVRRRGDPLPEDVTHALSRVESEAIRMGSLVEDMLLLARLDEHRPLDQDVVDLVEVIAEAIGDARAAGPDHVWRDTLPDSEVLVVGDQARLTQVVVNLLAQRPHAHSDGHRDRRPPERRRRRRRRVRGVAGPRQRARDACRPGRRGIRALHQGRLLPFQGCRKHRPGVVHRRCRGARPWGYCAPGVDPRTRDGGHGPAPPCGPGRPARSGSLRAGRRCSCAGLASGA